MRARRTPPALLAAALAGVLALGLAAATPASGSAADQPSPPTSPPASKGPAGLTRPSTSVAVPNPAAIPSAEGWTVLSTGSWAKPQTITRASSLNGPWKRTGLRLLTRKPKWMGGDRGVWAPSVALAPDGRYVTFYSGEVKGHPGRRCIGTGYNDTGSLRTPMSATGKPRALFEPRGKPLVCFAGSGFEAADVVTGQKAGSIIDATPAVLDGSLWLTYKTQARVSGKWLTTTRLVPLDPAKPDKRIAAPSTSMTRWLSPSIEENPVLIKRGSTYTLFTSRGWYRRCSGPYPYHTVYRQTKDLSSWPKQPRGLGFATSIHTCGKGNATVTSPDGASFFFLWNGHYPASRDGKTAPKSLYVAPIGWHKGRPRVKAPVLR